MDAAVGSFGEEEGDDDLSSTSDSSACSSSSSSSRYSRRRTKKKEAKKAAKRAAKMLKAGYEEDDPKNIAHEKFDSVWHGKKLRDKALARQPLYNIGFIDMRNGYLQKLLSRASLQAPTSITSCGRARSSIASRHGVSSPTSSQALSHRPRRCSRSTRPRPRRKMYGTRRSPAREGRG